MTWNHPKSLAENRIWWGGFWTCSLVRFKWIELKCNWKEKTSNQWKKIASGKVVLNHVDNTFQINWLWPQKDQRHVSQIKKKSENECWIDVENRIIIISVLGPLKIQICGLCRHEIAFSRKQFDWMGRQWHELCNTWAFASYQWWNWNISNKRKKCKLLLMLRIHFFYLYLTMLQDTAMQNSSDATPNWNDINLVGLFLALNSA